jgi:hypothetical protein
MNDSKNSVGSPEVGFEFPPPGLFDEIASAKAQPVRPIPTSRVSVWIQRAHDTAHDTRQMLTTRTKALALVLVGGLAIGTLGGTMLVKQRFSPDAAPVVQESAAETTTAQAAPGDPSPNTEPSAEEASAMALQSVTKTSSRIRRHRHRLPVQRSQAYRVDVIR